MAVLTTKKRNSLPKGKFAMPGQKKYPIPDKIHGINALARARQQGPSVYATVKKVVCRAFPGLPACKVGK